VPEWTGDNIVVAPHLVEAFQTEGRVGLARTLFDAEVISGEWWVDCLGGAVLSRQTAAQFDWDRRQQAHHVIEPDTTPDVLLEHQPPDLRDLLRKLGGVQALWAERDKVFLASPLAITERKDILFTLVGDDIRLLPDELAELEPSLTIHPTKLLGTRRQTTSNVATVPKSPFEGFARELERLPANPTDLGPIEPVREVVQRLRDLVSGRAASLAEWFEQATQARPVLGPASTHLEALASICSNLAPACGEIVLLTTAFLNEQNARAEDGLADVFAAAPEGTRFLVVYGHANDDLPEQIVQDVREFTAGLLTRLPSLAGRALTVPGQRRSHEKVVVSTRGDWMVGSWNPGSSRPGSSVFEASLVGCDADFALRLVERISENIDDAGANELLDALRRQLTSSLNKRPDGDSAVALLERATAVLHAAVPDDDGGFSSAWTAAVVATRAALHPFISRIHAHIVDEHQTRDMFLALIRSSRRDILLASDRLTESALDRATLHDLRGESRGRRLVRVVWGREQAGRRNSNPLVEEQLQRGQRKVREAREYLGSALLTQDSPMANHTKLVIVDGGRGLVTSENLLSYGGEKSRRESRELGIAFWSPPISRHIVGGMIHHWPSTLKGDDQWSDDSAIIEWCVALGYLWHRQSLAVPNETNNSHPPERTAEDLLAQLLKRSSQADRIQFSGLAQLRERFGEALCERLAEEGARLGLLNSSAPTWWPYDAVYAPGAEQKVAAAEDEVGRLGPRSQKSLPQPTKTTSESHSLVGQIMQNMVEIEAGTFWMGDERVADERPRHQVTISRSFLIGRTPVTQGVWESVMGRLPHLRDVERHPNFPIIHISHPDMLAFLDRLNALPGGGGFALPTEAQWEYACRAGSDHTYCFGDHPGTDRAPGQLEQYAWTKRSSGARLHAVGELRPNGFGLYDMHGLVYEAMRDGHRHYAREHVTDPVGPLQGDRIVARGGFWGRFPVDPRNPMNEHFRSASRQTYEKSHRVSFRIVRTMGGGN
jgi:formylglycine-generating enzyme required for sulfatase activity